MHLFFEKHPSVCGCPEQKLANVEAASASTQRDFGTPAATQNSFDDKAPGIAGPNVNEETFSETEKCTCASIEGALNCCFHVMQNLSNHRSFVGDFENKAHCDSKNGGLAHKHVQMIHHCKTQFLRN